jgi:TctA family transporter
MARRCVSRTFLSYGIAKRVSGRGHNFGKGEIEGVVAPETAAHAADGADAFRQSRLGSQGRLGAFFSNGLVGTIMMLGLIALFWPLIQNFWTRVRRPATA